MHYIFSGFHRYWYLQIFLGVLWCISSFSGVYAANNADVLTAGHKDLFSRFLPSADEDRICRSANWDSGIIKNFTNTKGLDFAMYGDTDALEKIEASIEAYPGGVPMSGDRLSAMINYFDTNTELYNSMMNRIFACSLIQARSSVYAKYLSPSSTTLRLTKDSKFVDTLKALNEKNSEEIARYGCLNISKQPTESVEAYGGLASDTQSKAQLINAATYMSCRYQAYIEYSRVFMDTAEAQILIAKRTGLEGDGVDEGLSNRITELSTHSILAAQDMMTRRLDAADGLALKVVPQTLASTLVYQKAYEIHILLLLVRDEYLVMRQRLDDALSPFTQWIYKAQNVSSPGR